MDFLAYYEQLIPGYSQLDEDIRVRFENKEAGKKLKKVVAEHKQNYWVASFFTTAEIEEATQTQFIDEIKNDTDYQAILIEITRKILSSTFHYFNFLTDQQQIRLANQEASRRLCQVIINAPNATTQSIPEELYHDERMALEQNRWELMFNNHLEIESFKQTIKDNQTDLHHKIQTKLRDHDYAVPHLPFLLKEEKIQLTKIFYTHFQDACALHLSDLNLEQFNAEQATMISMKRLRPSAIDACLDDYTSALKDHLIKTLSLNDGVNCHGFAHDSITQEITSSLSSAFYNSVLCQQAQQGGAQAIAFMNALADAHGFIQAIGFSTQNERSHLALLDIYNYGRHMEAIAETKNIIYSILSPLTPLIEEYKHIAKYEKNTFNIFMRAVLPMLVVAAFIFVIAALLAPFSIPEIGFAVILIPTLYIGLALAAQYVLCRDIIYHSVRQAYYHGAYLIPEFQINSRMRTGFGDESAQIVHDYYIAEFKRCVSIETSYEQKPTLSSDQIKHREENKFRKHQLSLEWYDIHTNEKLGHDELKKIVINRLKLDGKKAVHDVDECKNQDAQDISSLTQEIKTDIKARFQQTERPEPSNRHQFFIATRLKDKEHIEELDSHIKKITNN